MRELQAEGGLGQAGGVSMAERRATDVWAGPDFKAPVHDVRG